MEPWIVEVLEWLAKRSLAQDALLDVVLLANTANARTIAVRELRERLHEIDKSMPQALAAVKKDGGGR